MSFTPGPWKTIYTDADYVVGIFDRNHDIVSNVYGYKWHPAKRTSEEYEGVALANARLIAAAPEMLEALEEAIPVLTDAIEDSYCGMHRGRGLCDCKSDIVARISTIIARTKETPNA